MLYTILCPSPPGLPGVVTRATQALPCPPLPAPSKVQFVKSASPLIFICKIQFVGVIESVFVPPDAAAQDV